MVIDEGTEGSEAALTLTEVSGDDAIDLSLLSISHMTEHDLWLRCGLFSWFFISFGLIRMLIVSL